MDSFGLTLAAGVAEGEQNLLRLLVHLCVIIAAARLFALVFRKLGQPQVVGEIFAGIALGPSAFGALLPEVSQHLFGDPQTPDTVAQTLRVLSQLGLVFLLFVVGLEFDFTHLKRRGYASALVSIAGVAAPLALGCALGWWQHPLVAGDVHRWGFVLFMGVAMSITALPVLGRIMMELNLTRTRLGAITIASAAIDDVVGWTLLATVSAIVSTGFDPLRTLTMMGLTLGFFLLMLFAARPVLRWWIARSLRAGGGELGLGALAGVFIVLFLCAAATSRIGIFAVFGAFILGAVLSDLEAFREAVRHKLSHFVTVLFLPIFFTYTGLHTNIGTLKTGHLWLMAGLVLLTAVAGKFGGCTLAAWAGGFRRREAACIGVMMNTRGLMELVVINVGRELGVIPQSVFTMLVLMALVTTVMTTPILLRLAKGTELEPYVAASAFRRRGPGQGNGGRPSVAPP